MLSRRYTSSSAGQLVHRLSAGTACSYPPSSKHGLRNYYGSYCASQDKSPAAWDFSRDTRRTPKIVARHFHTTQSLREADPTANDYTGWGSFAILGGGITGLTAAFRLTNKFPDRKIVLFESKEALGGWIGTHYVDVGTGTVIFESGPRSLRPGGLAGRATLSLIQDLGLIDDMLVTEQSSPAAQNRFIYYPDHLVRMPSGTKDIPGFLAALLQEPIFSGFLRGVLNDLVNPTRSPSIHDESVGEFISRRFHKNVGNNIASAMFHGIYAGDIWKLSARTILSSFWAKEQRYGSFHTAMLSNMLNKSDWKFCDDLVYAAALKLVERDPELVEKVRDCSVFTFKKGMRQLVDRLEETLRMNPNVTIVTSAAVSKIAMTSNRKAIQVGYSTEDGHFRNALFSHMFSTIRPNKLLSLLDNSHPNPDIHLSDQNTLWKQVQLFFENYTASTVCVVNLYYSTPHLLKTLQPPGGLPRSLGPNGLEGFGYLMPLTLPFEQNPERALGVIFDSDISPDLYTTVPRESLGTRLTVMLGGHFWDDWTSYPSKSEAKDMATQVLARHLGISEEPLVTKVSLQKDCIPQYHVGHQRRMGGLHHLLLTHFDTRLMVGGSWFNGVGVNDCVKSADFMARGLRGAYDSSSEHTNPRRIQTGVEFAVERPMALVKNFSLDSFEPSDIIEMDEYGRKLGMLDQIHKLARNSANRR